MKQWPGYWCALIVGALVALGLAGPAAGAPSRGIAFIGASNTSNADIDFVADRLASAGGDVEFAFLPFEFNPDDPFRRGSRLVRRTLRHSNARLHVTVYLRWYFHDGTSPGEAQQRAFWDAWQTDSPSRRQKRIRKRYRADVDAAVVWVAAMRDWANQHGAAGRLTFTFVPVLEDTCTSRRAFRNVIEMIQNRQDRAGVARTAYRRSHLWQRSAYRFAPVPGVTTELHGTWSQVRGFLRPGDTWTNDGTGYNVGSFISDLRAARAAGVSVGYWDQLYNGRDRNGANWPQRPVDPFSGSGGGGRRQDFARVMRG